MNYQQMQRDAEAQAKAKGVLFYRCILCASPVSKWDIQAHQGCAKCGNSRIRPSNLSLWEKLVQIIKHPRVWAWNE
jgi:DNA-directed RNA polymerase subunit RPC12/RpoP